MTRRSFVRYGHAVSSGRTAASSSPPSRKRRMFKILERLALIAVFLVVLNLLGVDIIGWLDSLWDEIKDIPPGYMIGACIVQFGQTFFAGVSYYGILKYAYPAEVELWPIVAAYSVGVALNGFLPANLGTFVTLMMFIAIIPSCGFAGALGAYIVQKIFFTIIGTFVYLYMFLSVPGSFDVSFGNLTSHPALVFGIVIAGILIIYLLIRMFWGRIKAKVTSAWDQAKDGGAILSEPRVYLRKSFLPSFISWCCKLGVIAIFLAAFAIPVTFESVIWVSGSGSLANMVSFTPGSIGVTQATNALALDTCCDVPYQQAVDYSTAQQLLMTAWNQVVALVLVVWVFGWTGGKQLVGESYEDAKVKTAEMKADRAAKKAEKKAEKQRRKAAESQIGG
jgi:uncharacterized membrane protein YbhN (UPF0104 family)